MTNINSTFATINSMNLKRDFGAAQDAQQPHGAILGKNPAYYKYEGKGNDLIGVGEGAGGNHAGDGGSIWDYSNNHSNNSLLVQNKNGLKNTRVAVLTDKGDTVNFGGTGWKETKNYTDTSNDPHTKGKKGSLYQDGNGNQFLVLGGAQVNVQA